MGNICGKADSDNFAQPGRVLGSAPPPQEGRAALPSHVTATASSRVGGPPRTLGGKTAGGGGGGGGQSQESPDEARRRAAEAAEARARANDSKASGKLSAQLAAQKRQANNQTLEGTSREALRQREIDEVDEARFHN